MTKKTLLFALPLVLMISCVKEERVKPLSVEYPAGEKEIFVEPVLLKEGWLPLGGVTRALSDLTAKEVDSTYLADNGFGLYAYYTAKDDFVSVNDDTVKGLVFNKRKFLYNGTVWKNYQWDGVDYSHEGKAEFWPTSSQHKLSFFAFAPWAPWYTEVTTSASYASPYIVYDSYVAQDLTAGELEGQEDVLWGTNTSGMAHKNVNMSSYTPEGTVDMHFRHAPAKVSFSIHGTLSGATVSTGGGSVPAFDSTRGNVEESSGNVQQSGPTTSETYYQGNMRYQYRITEYTITERQDQDVVMRRTATITTSGRRYLIDNLTLNGFNKTGTLLLDNGDAYKPTWVIGDETLTYSLTPSNVLTTSLQAVSEATIRSSISTYTGIGATPVDMMSGYYLYAIPKEISLSSPAIGVSLTYKVANVSGSETVTQKGPSTRYRTRVGKRYFVEQRSRRNNTYTWGDWTSSGTAVISGIVEGNRLGWTPSQNGFVYAYDWDDEVNLPWTYGDVADEDWTTVPGSSTPNGTPSATYVETKNLSGKIVTPFLGGSAYTVNLIVSGQLMELVVVPNPWELEDEPPFTYDDNENKIIHYLDYDSAFVDYVDGGNVYINNRMGKFYFQMDEGKYVSWKASLEGAPGSFGFTDENGQWIMDGNHRATSIGGAINPAVMNYIYIKAVDPASPNTNRAKLRIRCTDSYGDDTVILNLVNNEDVVEWTIVQNAQ